ncbi:hypothetical protein [uncultured Hymenobacter sp.]|uniref:hypothetical protein n=1 Tax=uncultured Hymenobacter sp. TaxID=170016 RepID=UPI0035C95504
MPLHPQLAEKLSKLYEPSATIADRFKGHDITFVTNAAGEPVTLFIGRRQPDGHIAGQRYVRTIKRGGPDGQQVIHSHWDLKGTSRA